jgi:type II secretory pathway pseudopilin PulG
VLAILGILLALAVPRYLGARKRAYKAEVDNLLQEMKTLSWAYYQEYNTMPTDVSLIGFQMPTGSAWNTPVDSSGDYLQSVIWTASGNGTKAVVTADLCSLILTTVGSSGQGCSF